MENLPNLKPSNNFINNCEIHGDNVESLLNGSCRQCRQLEKDKEKADKITRIKNEILLASNIPKRYSNSTFDNYKITDYKQTEIIKLLKTYAGETNLLLLGTTGTGKTHLACAMIKNYILNMIFTDYYIENFNFKHRVISPCSYVKYYEIAQIKVEEKNKYIELLNSEILVIDEIGTNTTDFKQGLLFEIIDYRYDNMLHTVLISNLGTDAFRSLISAPLYSRVKENYAIENCTWNDYRINNS